MRSLLVALVAGSLISGGLAGAPRAAATTAPVDVWSASGNSATTTDAGDTGTPTFSYQVSAVGPDGTGSGISDSWSFSSAAAAAEDVPVTWTWSGYAAYCDASIDLKAFIAPVGGSPQYTDLEHDTADCRTHSHQYPYGDFTAADSYTFAGLQSGDQYGFVLASSNLDTDSRLSGTFSVTETNVAPPSPFIGGAPAGNSSWTTATTLQATDTASDSIDEPGGARWYRFPVQPDSSVTVSLTNLPADDSLSVFSDIAQTFAADEAILAGDSTTSALTQLSAEQPGNAASPSAFSPSAFSPSAFSPSAFSPSAFSPSAFSPSAFSPSAFSPSAFSPSAFSPSAFSPSAFSPSAFSPSAFSPSAFSPSAFSAAYASAQVQSLLAISTQTGTANKSVTIDTWNTTGFDYIRVSGNNGASSEEPFTLNVTTTGGPCDGVTLNTYSSDSTIIGSPGSNRTVIATDSQRLPQTPALTNALQGLAAATDGVIVDVSKSHKVVDLEAQADAHSACPYAEDLVAQAISDIVQSYRQGAGSQDSLKYVVIVGDDDVIPFFRYADASGLAPESDYVPPVLSTSHAAGALNSNDYLSDDGYGSLTSLTIKGATVPVPDLAIGRLVESPSEIAAQINNYLADPQGNIPQPQSSLVTGYDFMAPVADQVEASFAAGLGPGATNDTLITDQGVSPAKTTQNGQPDRSHSWTASDLATSLFGSHHDLVFLGGHFSANNTLAADYSSTLLTTDLATAVDKNPGLFTNTLVLGAGCHAGYNLEDADGVPDVTLGLDWAEAFAKSGASLISGTGYQYGDTDFVAYSDKLYVDIAQQLNTGTGPVAIGTALTAAKQSYLSGLYQLTGMDQKAELETTLYGLPMLGVDMPAGRAPSEQSTSTVNPSGVSADPGKKLGLKSADLTVAPTLTTHHQAVDDLNGQPTGASYTWLSGPKDSDIVSEPSDPTLPLVTTNVSVPGEVLRGVGFRSGSYSDLPGITPLTGAPTTEVNSVHAPFASPVFFPQTLATPNYFGALGGSGALTNLLVTPAQHIQDGPTTDTLRQYADVGFRLFYDDNTTSYGDNTPALAGPPTISQVTSTVKPDGSVDVSTHVAGDPSAGVHAVWVTYTGATPDDPYFGSWQSVDLQQDPLGTGDSTLWTGTIPAPPSGRSNDVFLAQAVSGTGVVAANNNNGAYFAAGTTPGAASTGGATALVLDPGNPDSGQYTSTVDVSATLTGVHPLAGRTITFGLGSVTVQATTDDSGLATATLSLNQPPGNGYDLTASYGGDTDAQPASTDSPGFTIDQAPTQLTVSGPSGPVQAGNDAGVTATLSSDGHAVQRKPVYFSVIGPDGTSTSSVVASTNGAGQVALGAAALAPGTDSVTAYFGSSGIPLASGGTIDGSDVDYAAAHVSTTLDVTTTTSTILTASAATYGHPVVLSAVVAPSDGHGTVSFTADGSGTPIAGCGAQTLHKNTAGAEAATCSVPSLDASSHTFRADFAGTHTYLASHASATTAIAPASTTTKLAAPASTSYGSGVTLSATVSTDAAAGRAGGTVSFYDGAGDTPAGVITLPASGPNVAALTITGSAAADHAFRAVYSGDANHATSADATNTTVHQETTGTVVTAPASAPYGHDVVLVATVTPFDGGGTVGFAGVPHCAALALAAAAGGSGTASCTVSALDVGPHSFTALYSGDHNLLASSGSGSTTVAKASTTTTVAAPATATYGSSVKVTATVSATGDGDDPTGTVSFYDASTLLGTRALPGDGSGTASLTLTKPAAATHSLRAVFAGDSHYTGSVGTATTSIRSETTHTSMVAAPAVFGQPVILTATVSPTDGGGTVGFTADGKPASGCAHVAVVITAAAGAASCAVKGLSVGSHSFRSTYSGDANDTPSSAARVSTRVARAPSSLVLRAPTSSRFGAPVTLTATVAPGLTGTGQPAGRVTFTSAGNVLGSARLTATRSGANTASLTLSGLPAGGNAIVARFPGDTHFTASSDSATDVVGFTSVIRGTTGGGLTVRSGQSVLVTGTVSGAVTVRRGGALEVLGSIAGPVVSVRGAVGMTLCGATIHGPVTVELSHAWIAIGGAGCSLTSISSPLRLVGNSGGLLISRTSVTGSVVVAHNTGRPGATISGNTIAGSLSCRFNFPAPTDAGVANTATTRSGQCASPDF